ncbi:MAG: hypothetical protein AAF358_18910 [Pseudomonadota bacterium]
MSNRLPAFTRVLARSLGVSIDDLDAAFGPCQKKEIAEVSALRTEVFGADISPGDEDYLYWRYFSKDADKSTLLCLRHEGEIIAALGTEPCSVRVGEHIAEGVKCADAIVKPRFDGGGIGAWMNMVQMDRHDVVICIGGNTNSLSMLKKLFTGLPIRQDYKLPLGPMHLLLKKHSVAAPLWPLAPFADWLFRSWQAFRLRSASDDPRVSRYGQIDELVSKMPPAARNRLGKKALVRSGPYLEWRYSPSSGRSYRFFGVETRGVLDAYVVAKVAGTGNASKRGLIMDWDYSNDDQGQSTFAAILRVVIQEMVRTPVHMVQTTVNDPRSAHVLRSLGFLRRGEDSRFFVKVGNPDYQTLEQPDGWFVSLGDSDGV